MTKIAFFDAKPYDKPGFEKYGPPAGIEFKYYESKLDADTAGLAEGCAGVVAFVNDSLNAPTLQRLYDMGNAWSRCAAPDSTTSILKRPAEKCMSYAYPHTLPMRWRSMPWQCS